MWQNIAEPIISPYDVRMSVGHVTATRVEARLETHERVVDQVGATPAALHARMAEAVVMQAQETRPHAQWDDPVTCTLHTEVVRLHPGGPVDLVAQRLQAGPGGQLWTVEATTPDGYLIAHSRVRLIRAADMAAVRHHQTPTT